MIKTLWRLVLLSAIAVAGWMAYFATTPLNLPQTPYEFTLKHGSSLRSVARQLVEAKILAEPWSFTALVRINGKEGEIKAGNYYLKVWTNNSSGRGTYTLNAQIFGFC